MSLPSSARSIIAENLTLLRAEYEQVVHDAMTVNLDSHNDRHDGFTPLTPNVDEHDFQRLDCISVLGRNASPQELRELAQLIYPKTSRVIDMFKQRGDLLNHAASLLLDGKEIALMGNHYQSVIGVAILGGALSCALFEETPLTPDDIDINLIASFFIKYTLLQGLMPTSTALSSIFSQTTYTLPPSPHNRGAIPQAVRTPVNTTSMEFMMSGRFNELDSLVPREKGRLTIFAGSGRRDVTVPARRGIRPTTTHLGPLAYGTSRIVSVIPTIGSGIDMSHTNPRVFIGELPPRPSDKPHAPHAIMQQIAIGMSTRRHEHIYHNQTASFIEATTSED